MQKEIDVFISYSRKDYVDEQKNVIPGNEVSKVKDALTKAGITYWFDEEGIYSGENFVEKIVTNIEKAKIFVFLSTANANKSPWTSKEIASADEFKKHIIPVRIDSSPYNKKVLFRIADLDYIEYYTNPEKGIADLIKAIKNYLSDLAAEEKQKKEIERLKQEELRHQKELEEKRQQEEQERYISEIKLSCTTLNNEETKLELDRETLLLKTKRIADSSTREALICQIKSGGPIHQKYQKEYSILKKKYELQEEEYFLLKEKVAKQDSSDVNSEKNDTQEHKMAKGSNEFKLMLIAASIGIVVWSVAFLIYYVYDSEQTENNAFRSYNTIECDSSKIALNDLTLEKANQFFENEQYKKAFYVYSIFAVQGNPTAQYVIGVCYDNGHGIEQNYTQAVAWYRKAAEQGEPNAQCLLGECYYYGKGVEQNYIQAVGWYRKAAKQGEAYAQYSLGYCYDNGQGIEQDVTQAVNWYCKAAEQGHEWAIKRLKELDEYKDAIEVADTILP